MNRQLTLTQKHTFKTLSLVSMMMLTLLAFNPIYGQTKTTATKITTNERTIKGLISNEDAEANGNK